MASRFCGALKSNDKIKDVPVIILSSHDKERDIEHGFEVGASAYVSKTNAQQQLSPCCGKSSPESQPAEKASGLGGG